MSHTDPTTPQLSPYMAAQIATRVLLEKGVDKEIPGQMMYNYVRQGTIAATKVDGRWVIDFESFTNWLRRYVTNQVNKKARHNMIEDIAASIDI